MHLPFQEPPLHLASRPTTSESTPVGFRHLQESGHYSGYGPPGGYAPNQEDADPYDPEQEMVHSENSLEDNETPPSAPATAYIPQGEPQVDVQRQQETPLQHGTCPTTVDTKLPSPRPSQEVLLNMPNLDEEEIEDIFEN
jgi:hypothetical protein